MTDQSKYTWTLTGGNMNDQIISYVENVKLNDIFSEKRKPDIILSDKSDMVLALKYNSKTMDAPIVVLKGRNLYAQKVLNISDNKNITIVENKELVSDMYLNIKSGQTIPPKYYQEVAMIYARMKTETELTENKENNHFDDCFNIHRQKRHETVFIQTPEKIKLELSHNLASIIEAPAFEATVLGLKFPVIKYTENKGLSDDCFCIKINGTDVKQGSVKYSNIDIVSQLNLYLSKALYEFSVELLIGRDDVVNLISQIKEKYPVLIEEVMKHYSIGDIRKVLCGLLDERVSIQNLIGILETVADSGERSENNMDQIIENVRISPYLDANRTLRVINFCYEAEVLISSNIITEENKQPIRPVFYGSLLNVLVNAIKSVERKRIKPIILCVQTKRKVLKNILKNIYPEIIVLSFLEIPREVTIESILELKVSDFTLKE
jgi:flagellar biosynthesis component FlhA